MKEEKEGTKNLFSQQDSEAQFINQDDFDDDDY